MVEQLAIVTTPEVIPIVLLLWCNSSLRSLYLDCNSALKIYNSKAMNNQSKTDEIEETDEIVKELFLILFLRS